MRLQRGRAAAKAGGEVIGVLPGIDLAEANPDCTHVVATGTGQARSIGRTVVALRSWALVGRDRMEGAPGVIPVETPEEAVAAALADIHLIGHL